MEKTVVAAPIHPEQLLRELDQLWVSLARQSEGGEAGGVMRACAMTLIVVCEHTGDAPGAGETVAELMRVHPCRAILLCVRPSEVRRIDGRVTAQCWMPLGKHQQICCEQIEVTVPEQSLPSLPQFVAPLTAPDLPVVIWFRASRLAAVPAFQQLSRMADVIIVDSAQLGGIGGFRRLETSLGKGARAADLAWTRLTPWREIIAQIFENPVARQRAGRISDAAISVGETRGAPHPAEVYYFAAWLARGLGNASVVLQPASGGTAGVQGITLSAPDLAISVTLRDRSTVEVQVNAVTRSTAFPPPTDCDLLREELAITGRDRVFEESVTLAEQLASHGGGNP
jgi:glucose-6-phosphate dehydrogenase assembly protein OpcA